MESDKSQVKTLTNLHKQSDFSVYIMHMDYRISSVIRHIISFQNNPKDLDPS